jgi:hypothetical protein
MKTDSIPFGLSFIQAIQAIGFIVMCVVVLLIVCAIVLDKLNVKSFSFKTGFTFYEDGDIKKSRITRRKKTVIRRKKAVK